MEIPAQQPLDFGTVDGARALPTSVEARVYCDAPVAQAADRATAAAIDLLIPCCGFAVFLTAFGFAGGQVVVDKHSLPFYAAAFLLIGLFYRLLCCAGNMDTPGMQWAGLILLDFDGHLPTPRARFFRLAGGMVSTLPVGIGLWWSLLDEERLTWHDYMSGTFPTARDVG